MNLITWNCQMAFRKKAQNILALQPDILIVPECEHLAKLHFTEGTTLPKDQLWYGNNPHKGLGVFSYGDYRLALLTCHNPEFKNILPISVTGGSIDFTLFAVWANNPEDKDGAYVTQIWKALAYYEPFLNHETIWIGDFNSNSIWDKPKRNGNHSDVVALFAQKNIHSVYHVHQQQLHGTEKDPTFYLYKHVDKPYHLDYCFASEAFLDQLQDVRLGTHQDWMPHSDHVPLQVRFKLKCD